MTKFAVFTFTTMVLLFSYGISGAQWITGNQPNVDVNPCVSMVSANTVFLAGGDKNNTSKGVVYKSTDGGITFTSVRMHNSIKKVFSVFSASANTIYVGEGNNDGGLLKGAKVWKTTDNGLTLSLIHI